MPLYLGDSKASKLYLGDTAIKKAYLGDTLVFGKQKKPSSLPEGYTEVEYIQFDTKTGFDTGLYLTPSSAIVTLDIETDVVYSGVEEEFASMLASKAGQSSSAMYMLAFGRVSETRIYCRAGAAYNPALTNHHTTYLNASITGKRLTVVYNGPKSLFWVGEESVSISRITNKLYEKTFYIGAPVNTWTSIPYKLYSSQIKQSNSNLRDFVPCISPNGTVGLYDLIYGAFYQNSLTGTVTAGPVM